MYLESPRWLKWRADSVESWPSVDITDLHRGGIVALDLDVPEMGGSGRGTEMSYDRECQTLTLMRPHTARQVVRIEWTKCRLGGQRAWFRCPLCGTRRVMLHCVQGQWACRVCHGLRYDSQRCTPRRRKRLRASRLRQKLGQTNAGILDEVRKPKYAKWANFLALEQRIYELEFDYFLPTPCRDEYRDEVIRLQREMRMVFDDRFREAVLKRREDQSRLESDAPEGQERMEESIR
jgi:hypothetical protein